ncbi:hypothetical protein TSUD_409250 [Trifolium subterraneum]|uniref:Helitron helicase-like domain-containing protein n=1 Tax=Trifolium subterraneum TaxID=3900 RepID=A0A2Z6PIJ5_TRISU|nr:hypothetical protein TSUD_409250 [Trifolium subterraneum]
MIMSSRTKRTNAFKDNSIEITPVSEVVDPEPSNTRLTCRNRYANIVSAVAPTRIDFEDDYASDNEDDSCDYAVCHDGGKVEPTIIDFEDDYVSDNEDDNCDYAGNEEDQYYPEDEYDQAIHSMTYQDAESELCHDVGDPSFICKFCSSRMWFDERAEQDMSIRNDGGGPPQVVLSGQNYHRIESLLPEQGGTPKFAQLYIYDTKNEDHNRMKHVSSTDSSKSLDRVLVEDLKHMIDASSRLAKKFREIRDHVEQGGTPNFSLRLIGSRSKEATTHNLPTYDKVAALIIGDDRNIKKGRDVIVKNSSGEFQRIYETHRLFLPLQYPLLFPYGEYGFELNIPIRSENHGNRKRKRLFVAIREFIAFRVQDRTVEYGNIVLSRRLFQQFVVDCYTMIESLRLKFIRENQQTIRCDILSGLQEAMDRGETDPSNVGKKIVLPASFTGGRRYMFNNCQDAMAICKKYGYPDLVFKMKLDRMMDDFKKEQFFGPVDATHPNLAFDLYLKGIKKEHSPMLFLFLYDTCTCNKDILEHQVQPSAAVFIHNSWPFRALASLLQKEEIHSRQILENGLRPMLERGENIYLE